MSQPNKDVAFESIYTNKMHPIGSLTLKPQTKPPLPTMEKAIKDNDEMEVKEDVDVQKGNKTVFYCLSCFNKT